MLISDLSPWAWETEDEINKWDYIKLKVFAQQRKPSARSKDSPLNGRTYLPMILVIRG